MSVVVNGSTVVVDWKATEYIQLFRGTPRFGHTKDISALVLGSQYRTSYLTGISSMGALVVSLFLVWLLIILAFKFLGKRVGFLSGRPFQVEEESFKRANNTPRSGARFTNEIQSVESFNSDVFDGVSESIAGDLSSFAGRTQGSMDASTVQAGNLTGLNRSQDSEAGSSIRAHDSEAGSSMRRVPSRHLKSLHSISECSATSTGTPLQQVPRKLATSMDHFFTPADGGSTMLVVADEEMDEDTSQTSGVERFRKDSWEDEPLEEVDERLKRNHDCVSSDGWSSPMPVRLIFLISAFVFAISAFLLVVKGIVNLQSSIDEVKTVTLRSYDIAQESSMLMHEATDRLGKASDIVLVTIQSDLEKDGLYCSGVTDFSSLDFEDAIRSKVKELTIELENAQLLLGQSNGTIGAALTGSADIARQAVARLAQVELSDSRVMITAVLFTVVPVIFIIVVVMTIFEVSLPMYAHFLDCFLLPLFIMMLLLACVVAGSTIAAAAATGDMCLSGERVEVPNIDLSYHNSTVLNVIQALGMNETEPAYQIADYFISQCRTQDPFWLIREALQTLERGEQLVDEATEILINGDTVMAEISFRCNSDFFAFQALLGEIANTIFALSHSLSRTLSLLY
jgi:hypothetical protein